MMIEHTIFAPSNTILSDQNSRFLSYYIVEEGLPKILLDQDVLSDHISLYLIIRSVIGLMNDPRLMLVLIILQKIHVNSLLEVSFPKICLFQIIVGKRDELCQFFLISCLSTYRT